MRKNFQLEGLAITFLNKGITSFQYQVYVALNLGGGSDQVALESSLPASITLFNDSAMEVLQ